MESDRKHFLNLLDDSLVETEDNHVVFGLNDHVLVGDHHPAGLFLLGQPKQADILALVEITHDCSNEGAWYHRQFTHPTANDLRTVGVTVGNDLERFGGAAAQTMDLRHVTSTDIGKEPTPSAPPETRA